MKLIRLSVVAILCVSCNGNTGYSNYANGIDDNASANDTVRVQSGRIYDGVKVDSKVIANAFGIPGGTGEQLLTADGGTTSIQINPVYSIKGINYTRVPNAAGLVTISTGNVTDTFRGNAGSVSNFTILATTDRILDVVTVTGYMRFKVISLGYPNTYFHVATIVEGYRPAGIFYGMATFLTPACLTGGIDVFNGGVGVLCPFTQKLDTYYTVVFTIKYVTQDDWY